MSGGGGSSTRLLSVAAFVGPSAAKCQRQSYLRSPARSTESDAARLGEITHPREWGAGGGGALRFRSKKSANTMAQFGRAADETVLRWHHRGVLRCKV